MAKPHKAWDCPCTPCQHWYRDQLTEARRLLREVLDAHRDPEAWDYNDCDTGMCQWCIDAKRVVGEAEKR